MIDAYDEYKAEKLRQELALRKQLNNYSQLVNLQENAALLGYDVQLSDENGTKVAKVDGYTIMAMTVPALVQGCYQVITRE